ncbi:MAG: class I SAM-dependent methyltransferase [Chitinophagaceae bacterium]|uniref:class I SAM-dependent methyltransferase n=1 Tax=unclassified Paraflavitalea TaxID=2798305 RepID=UPI003D335163|nr:class I SAM-dependent methyltransferase [Chitinophagaceae bacterium]
MHFTAHNVLLDSGERTMNDKLVLISESKVWSSANQILDFVFPKESFDRSKLRAVDIGCLEGGYSVELARSGFDTLGIEARQTNLDKCNYVKSGLNLANLKFVKDDAKNIESYGKFDVTFCYGLLYHLENPAKFLEALSRTTSKLLLLHTHYAPERDIRYELGMLNSRYLAPLHKRVQFLSSSRNYRLSKKTIHEGYRGRWYSEWSPNSTKSKIENLLWASYSNSKSFWLLKKDLTEILYKVGFDYVFEQHNFTGDIFDHSTVEYINRSMFVALKK